jgi:hypothetical protein
MNNQMSQSGYRDDTLFVLENSLGNILKPVSPNPDFVKKLGYRISHPSTITLERRTEMKAFALISFGLFSGVLIIWLLVSVFKYFFRQHGRE